MCHVNAYYDAIDDFITIYDFLKMALPSMIYTEPQKIRYIVHI